jgi:hypothetical protein
MRAWVRVGAVVVDKDEMTAANVRFKAFDLGGHETGVCKINLHHSKI